MILFRLENDFLHRNFFHTACRVRELVGAAYVCSGDFMEGNV